jgi:hypothetical protein
MSSITENQNSCTPIKSSCRKSYSKKKVVESHFKPFIGTFNKSKFVSRCMTCCNAVALFLSKWTQYIVAMNMTLLLRYLDAL